MIRIRDIKLPAGYDDGMIMDEIADVMCLDRIYPGNSYPDVSFRILRRSIDARKKPDIYYVLTVLVLIDESNEKKILRYFRENHKDRLLRKKADRIITDPVTEYAIPECGDTKLKNRPVVIGTGPAGLFAALILARRGFKPIVIERGDEVKNRTAKVENFWKTGELDPDTNVQFGEGGAGTFSDGKLTTLTKDKSGRNSFVIHTFYEHGAPEDITVDSHPHIGTDILKTVVKKISDEIRSLGGEICFLTKLTDMDVTGNSLRSVTVTDGRTRTQRVIDTDVCILCIGHSARDTFEMLYDKGIEMTQKSFACGFRVIHPQSMVNGWQYGFEDAKEHLLPPAEYKIANETSKGRRVYSFCMCPGGYVVNASSEENRCCVNGMSEYKRDSAFANSAIIAAVDPCDFDQDTVPKDHPLAGMYYQRNLEEAAFERGAGSIPVQRFSDFEEDRETGNAEGLDGAVMGRYKEASLRSIFSDDIEEALIESMHKFGYTMKGFDEEGIFLGTESRTSSPVRIERGDDLQSHVTGLYPCGEGAGYAGGIVSAAADGIRCAEAVIRRYTNEYL